MKAGELIDYNPAILWNMQSDKAYLVLHGKSGCKEEAETFSAIACSLGWQVLSVDLPGHGERKGEDDTFYPWNAVPELQMVMKWAKTRWHRVAFRANSIGAWFAMLAYGKDPPERALFVSPIVDMYV